MKFEYQIARRLNAASRKSFSRTIIRLSILAITLSMTVMIIASSVVRGFKHEISDKIFGFWGHIHITSDYAPSSMAYESTPMSANQHFLASLDTIKQLEYVCSNEAPIPVLVHNIHQPFVYGALLMFFFCVLVFFGLKNRSTNKIRYFTTAILFISGLLLLINHPFELPDIVRTSKGGIQHIQKYIHKEGIIKTRDQIEGIVLRGIDEDFNWDYLQNNIQQGSKLSLEVNSSKNEIIISKTTADRLELKLDDEFLIYFIQNDQSLARKFKVKGIYKTGLAEYDQTFALVNIRILQELNNWRPYKNFQTLTTFDEGETFFKIIKDQANSEADWVYAKNKLLSGDLNVVFDSFSNAILIPDELAKNRLLQVGDSIYFNYEDASFETFELGFIVGGIYKQNPAIQPNMIYCNYWTMNHLNQILPEQISGFEIFIDAIEDLDAVGNYVNYVTLLGKNYYASTIKEMESNIFDWLNLTDMNERIILLLMILVSIINMSTSLLILILERTNMIGILKALGASNWSVRKIFLYNAFQIIFKGLLWGNIIGIGLCLLQSHFGIIQLPEELYYVKVAPVELNLIQILLLNIGTIGITLTMLILPSLIVSRIHPVKAIKFK